MIPVNTNSSVKRDDVLGGHINLQKSYTGVPSLLAHLNTALRTSKSFLIGLQEPPVHFKKVSGFGKAHNLYYDRSANIIRAALFVSRDLNTWPVPDFTSGDMATCLWKTEETGFPEIMVTSVYLDINYETVCPSILRKLIRYCKVRKKELIICADTNAHSSLWNSPDTNKRGEAIEDLIFSQNLSIHNIGDHFTFYNRRCATIIDVTLSTGGIADRINRWRVSDSVYGSDHLLIDFHISINSHVAAKTRNLAQGDWNLFRDLLEPSLPQIPRYWDIPSLELAATALTDDILNALNQSHPLKTYRTKILAPKWWSSDLKIQRHKVKRAFSLFRKWRSQEDYDHLKASRKELSKAIKKAKRLDWQQFCSEASDPKKIALINRIVKARESHSLGLLRRDDGTMCQSPEESIKKLVDTHFPGSVDSTQLLNPDYIGLGDGLAEPQTVDFITTDKVRESLRSFGDNKAPGPDGLKPLVLKELGPATISRLTELYRATIRLGHVPKAWSDAKVIFPPKDGKKDYAETRSFRPITLSNFILKGLERIILWQVNETALHINPLSQNQHAFRQGRSTESALSVMVGQIECALDKKEFALGVFLDIQGAFDNVNPEAVISGMRKKGIQEEIVTWYNHYLLNRTITVEHKGVNIKRKLTRGTPQGGVFSPVAWNIQFDEFLQLFDEGRVHANGFADDGGLIICGNNPQLLMSRMQKAVNTALEWGKSVDLTFSPSKTVVVLFTKRRKFVMPNDLLMGDVRIPFSDQVKYLGVTLDSKLTWYPHFKNKLRAAKGHLLKVINATGKLWGTPPRSAKLLYTSIVRPAFTYGALVWAKACDTKGAQTQLTRLNRLALNMTGHFRRSTPTAGLEVITHTLPLLLQLQYVAVLAWRRTESLVRTLEGTSSPRNGHRQHCRLISTKLGIQDDLYDQIPLERQWKKAYKVNVDSFNLGQPGGSYDFDIYTDGSKINDHSGSGSVVYFNGKEVATTSFHLGRQATVFMGEICAIKEAAEWVLNNCKYNSVSMYVDSRAALQALAKNTVDTKLVKDTRQTLNLAGVTNSIELKWIKAHAGHLGNERADELAKLGTSVTCSRRVALALPKVEYMNHVKDRFLARWNLMWSERDDCRQTKHWFPTVNKKASQSVLFSDRTLYSSLVQLMTGHNFLKRHSALVDKSSDNECRLCMEDEESSLHFIAECPALAVQRLSVFGIHHLSIPLNWSKRQVVCFLREAPIDFLHGQEG